MFRNFFQKATGEAPYPYQERLATEGDTRSRLITVPTGLGKTAAAVISWIWRRRFAPDNVRSKTPRRLVYCLPMRVLAEQTYTQSIHWLSQLGLLAGEVSWRGGAPCQTAQLLNYTPEDSREPGWAKQNGDHGSGRIAVHLLMGGEARTEWLLWPEQDAVLIGTQDMLFSRALNRGYASRRRRWPMEFGLLNNDCLWVLDEVQLLGPGLATGLQLEAFRTNHIGSEKYFGTEKPCFSWYMSATANRRLLVSREWRDGATDKRPGDFVLELSADERSDAAGILAQRRLATKHLELRLDGNLNDSSLVESILTRHREMVATLCKAPPDIPRRTLIICNTVKRARLLFAAIQASMVNQQSPDLVLLHSRYRPVDRSRQQARLATQVPCDTGQIVVATQVVEAGVDLSSAVLWTEIAPIPSIVQRLGRLNRAGEFGKNGQSAHGWLPSCILVGVPTEKDDQAKAFLPYDQCECETAQRALSLLSHDASPANLERQLQPALAKALNPPAYSLQRHELLDFFDTDSNLSLGYTDVSPFVRGLDPETDIYIVWREWDGEDPPFNLDIDRNEICQVPIWQVRGKDGLSSWRQGFVWLGRERGWKPASPDNLMPGATLLLPSQAGGYQEELGWTGDSQNGPVSPCYEEPQHPTDEDLLSGLEYGWQSIDSHTCDVRDCLGTILSELAPVEVSLQASLAEAILWHDYGKALETWQEATRCLARAASIAWPNELAPVGKFSFRESPLLVGLTGNALRREMYRIKRSFAPSLRHEVASALALRQHHLSNQQESTLCHFLAEYLVMSHHGYVRKTLRDEMPREPGRIRREEDSVRGVREGASIPAFQVAGNLLSATPGLSIACRRMGRGPDGGESWTRSVLRLLDHFGPFRLAYYEALVRAADCRASARPRTGVFAAQPGPGAALLAGGTAG